MNLKVGNVTIQKRSYKLKLREWVELIILPTLLTCSCVEASVTTTWPGNLKSFGS